MSECSSRNQFTPEFADRTDLLLVRNLQENPRTSYSSLARELNMSDSTVRRRVQALFESGRVRMVALPRLRELGYTFSAIVQIVTEPGMARQVAQHLRDFSQATYVSISIARHSVCCILRARSLIELSEMINSRVASIPGVREWDAAVVSEVLKGWGDWRVPIDEDGFLEPEPFDHVQTRRK
jgi:Lrp/AsnC family transcriptional regulator, regulator for asnA, asnC and gidA